MKGAIDKTLFPGPGSTAITPELREILREAARFFDSRQVGQVGALGFRRTTELSRMLPCLDPLIREGILSPGKTRFLDMGCGDGRVNLFLSYLTRISVGIELDEWTLDEHPQLREDFLGLLERRGLPPPPGNIHLFCGDTLDRSLHRSIRERTGLGLRDFDLFYTYLTMQDEFAALIAKAAPAGAAFLVYGLERIQPRFPGLRLLTPGLSMNRILAVYIKE